MTRAIARLALAVVATPFLVPGAAGAPGAGPVDLGGRPAPASPAGQAWEASRKGVDLRASASPQGAAFDVSVQADLDPARRGDSGLHLGALDPELGPAAALSAVAVTLGPYAARALPSLGWGVGTGALYSRLDPDELLENATRSELYELLQEEPGLGMQEIADRTGHGWGTIVYHLERLEENGYLLSRTSGRARRFFPAGDVDPDEARDLALLREATPRRICRALLEDPGMSGRDLADELALAPSTVSKHVDRLEEAGLVVEEDDAGEKHYFTHDVPVDRTELVGDGALAA